MEQALKYSDHGVKYMLRRGQALLKPPRRPQALHSLFIILAAQVALGHVFKGDVRDRKRHDDDG